MKPEVVDALIIGGGFCGASTAKLLREKAPEARVVIVERNRAHGRKVGEATVEVTGIFLTRVLGISEILKRDHLPKHGLRFWFTDHRQRELHEMGETGPIDEPLLVSYQLDRAKLDESLLEVAQQTGAELLRSHRVTSIDFGQPLARVVIQAPDGETRTIEAKWVIDASGRQCYLSRQLGHYREVPEHPIAAVWARWKGVRPFPLPERGAKRRLATNHFCGFGYWVWMIPLGESDTSIGLVYDKRRFRFPPGAKLRERFEAFVRQHDGLRELMKDARIVDDDFLAYRQLSYKTDRYMGRGWASVGDAASFLDPIYSPGLDHASFSAYATASLIADDLNGSLNETTLNERIELHNSEFKRSYRRSLEALYLDKYELFGDAELLAATALFDTGTYYQGIVGPIEKNLELLRHPPFGVAIRQTRIAFLLIRAFRRRMVRIARFRMLAGRYGAGNLDLSIYPRTFRPGLPALKLIARGLIVWLRGEGQMGWWRLRHPRADLSEPAPRVSVEN